MPVHIGSRNSLLHYAPAQISHELRDITVFNELLNKRDARINMAFGPPIDPTDHAKDVDLDIQQLQFLVDNQLFKK